MTVAQPSTPAASPRQTEDILRAFHEEGRLAKAYDARLVARLWPFIRPHKRLLWLATAAILVTAAGSMLRPLVMLVTIDSVVARKDAHALLVGGFALAGIVVLEQSLGFVQIYATQVVGARSISDLRSHIFRFLHSLPLRYYDRQPLGRLVTRVTNDTDAILELFASGALNAIGDLVRLVGIVALMLTLDSHLSLVAFAAAPPVALIVILVRRRARDAYRSIRAVTARMNATMNEQVNGVGVVQAFTREQANLAEFEGINRAYRDAYIRSIKYEAIQDAAIETVAALCLASIVLYLGYEPVSFGTVVAFNAYLIQFFEPISALAQRYTQLQSAMAGAERVFALLDVPERDAGPRTDQSPQRPDEAFSFEHVRFEYRTGLPVINDLTLSVPLGQKVALVGPTGSGKTTLSSLLLRLYEPTQGTVRVLGDDTAALDRTELRRRFAVVPQDLFLFPGTVAENVAAGQRPDLRRVEQVLQRLSAYELIARRQGGIEAPVLEQGLNFSVGERQLLAFARALYRDAPIVVLDEATASVDSDTEARIQKALNELLRGRTALIIAHRLSTVRSADHIVVLRRGQIAEQGTHAELLAAQGLYSRLVRLQFQPNPQGAPPAPAQPA
jgi:ATP-binding cassette subfamily B multidrug efflux pump